MTPAAVPTVAIIGGGFTGAAIAWHLGRDPDLPPTRIVVVEPRRHLGGGLAYSADDPAFRINVSATKMSLDPGDGDDFARWLVETDAIASDADATTADGRSFPQRAVFGAYVAGRLAPLLAGGRIEHLHARAVAIARSGSTGFEIELDDGRHVLADLAVLALSHPPPEPPSSLKEGLAGHPRFVADTTAPGAFDVVRPDHRVLVVGTGLTGADVVASLDRRGHRAPITAISRRGLRSKGHLPFAVETRGDFSSTPELTTRRLLQAIRKEVAASEAAGLGWHPVLDAVRNQGAAIWAALSQPERRRLVRHLRPYWDVHRFRVAPQVAAALDRRIAAGTLDLFAASIVVAEIQADEMIVTLRRRDGTVLRARFDAVLVATGPAHRGALASQPALAGLGRQGFLRADPYGLGIDTDPHGRAVDHAGQPVPTLLIGGPMARGTFGELMGLPEVSTYARFIAGEIIGWRAMQDG